MGGGVTVIRSKNPPNVNAAAPPPVCHPKPLQETFHTPREEDFEDGRVGISTRASNKKGEVNPSGERGGGIRVDAPHSKKKENGEVLLQKLKSNKKKGETSRK